MTHIMIDHVDITVDITVNSIMITTTGEGIMELQELCSEITNNLSKACTLQDKDIDTLYVRVRDDELIVGSNFEIYGNYIYREGQWWFRTAYDGVDHARKHLTVDDVIEEVLALAWDNKRQLK